MMEEATARMLASHWEKGWNTPDLEVIMGPLAENVVFSSPFVTVMTGDPNRNSVVGYDSVRAYMGDALERAGEVRYTLRGTLLGADSAVLVYSFRLPDGEERNGADFMQVDASGKVVYWSSHYPFAAGEITHTIGPASSD